MSRANEDTKIDLKGFEAVVRLYNKSLYSWQKLPDVNSEGFVSALQEHKEKAKNKGLSRSQRYLVQELSMLYPNIVEEDVLDNQVDSVSIRIKELAANLPEGKDLGEVLTSKKSELGIRDIVVVPEQSKKHVYHVVADINIYQFTLRLLVTTQNVCKALEEAQEG